MIVAYEYRVNGGTPVDVGNVLNYIVPGLAADTSYNFELRSKDGSGNYSPWTSVFPGTTLSPYPPGLALEVISDSELLVTWDAPPDVEVPTAPVLTSATADSDTAITMIWTAATDNIGVTGYETRIDGGPWTDRGNVLTYQYIGLTPATSYDFEVRAYDAAGNFSDPSNLISEATDASVFDPESIAGLWMWLKADALGLANNDLLTGGWPDSSAANHDAAASGGFEPTFKTNIVNGLPVVRFAGGQLLSPSNASALTAGEIFIVISLGTADPPPAPQGLWYLGSDSANREYFPFSVDGVIYEQFGTDTRKTTVNPGTSLAAFNIYGVYSASGDYQSFLNGVSLFTTATNTVGFAASPLLGWNGVEFFTGDIAEILMYDNKLSDPDRAAVVAYLQDKYDL